MQRRGIASKCNCAFLGNLLEPGPHLGSTRRAWLDSVSDPRDRVPLQSHGRCHGRAHKQGGVLSHDWSDRCWVNAQPHCRQQVGRVVQGGIHKQLVWTREGRHREDDSLHARDEAPLPAADEGAAAGQERRDSSLEKEQRKSDPGLHLVGARKDAEREFLSSPNEPNHPPPKKTAREPSK